MVISKWCEWRSEECQWPNHRLNQLGNNINAGIDPMKSVQSMSGIYNSLARGTETVGFSISEDYS